MTFDRLIHSDWSTEPSGRTTAIAVRAGSGWHVGLPASTGDLERFIDLLCDPGTRTLAGFDFPLGLPERFGAATGVAGFADALTRFGTEEWADFYSVVQSVGDISPRRPFYPNAPGGRTQRQLVEALGFDSMDDLRRRCEKRTPTRRAACSLFWTLGGNQVGKAAITGWRDVVGHARARGCRLWPFDGGLDTPGNLIAETYPAEAYAHVDVGIRFTNGTSKRRQSDRARVAPNLHAWAARANVTLVSSLSAAIQDGFGPAPEGDDPFDALLGLFGMIEVVDGRRPDAPPDVDRVWEGWILGQHG